MNNNTHFRHTKRSLLSALLCCLCMLASAQQPLKNKIDSIIQTKKERADSLYRHVDSLAKEHRVIERIDSVIDKKHAKDNFDPKYIVRSKARWTLKARLNVSGAHLSTSSVDDGIKTTTDMDADLKTTISFAVSYRGFSLGLGVNPVKIFKKSSDMELNFNSYGAKLGFDITFQRANSFKGTAKSGDAGAGTSASSGVTVVQSTVYNDAESYVSALNGDDRWITYSPSAGGVTITSMWDFVKHCRPAQKGVCAFDALDRSTTSNQLFGVDDESSLHFDETVATLLGDNADKYSDLKGWKDDLVSDWAQDIVKLDSLKTDMQSRVNAMNPLYALSGRYAGFGSCEVAPHWRINTGLFQSATALCADVNLAVALGAYDGVKDVAFTPVWGRGFELAEASGDAQENFVSWVTDCCK